MNMFNKIIDQVAFTKREQNEPTRNVSTTRGRFAERWIQESKNNTSVESTARSVVNTAVTSSIKKNPFHKRAASPSSPATTQTPARTAPKQLDRSKFTMFESRKQQSPIRATPKPLDKSKTSLWDRPTSQPSSGVAPKPLDML